MQHAMSYRAYLNRLARFLPRSSPRTLLHARTVTLRAPPSGVPPSLLSPRHRGAPLSFCSSTVAAATAAAAKDAAAAAAAAADARYMALALAEASKAADAMEVPVGAVLVRDATGVGLPLTPGLSRDWLLGVIIECVLTCKMTW
jgi:hypothetical protein